MKFIASRQMANENEGGAGRPSELPRTSEACGCQLHEPAGERKSKRVPGKKAALAAPLSWRSFRPQINQMKRLVSSPNGLPMVFLLQRYRACRSGDEHWGPAIQLPGADDVSWD